MGLANKIKGKGTWSTKWGKWEKSGDLAEKRVTLSSCMSSNMLKPEKFDHFHLVYHFAIPLRVCQCYGFVFCEKDGWCLLWILTALQKKSYGLT